MLRRHGDILNDGSLYGIKVNYVEETVSNGTADSLRLLKGKIKANFLVVYGDIIFNKIRINELWDDHIRQNAISTIILTTSSKPLKKAQLRLRATRSLTSPRSQNSQIFT